MDALRRLCAERGSLLAVTARAQLTGVRAALHELLDTQGDDPGAASCREALHELDELLAHRREEPGVALAAETPKSRAGDELATLAGELATSGEAADYLGPLAVPAAADVARLWRWFHLTLLRLPRPYADRWRERARVMGARAGCAGRERWTEWPALEEEHLLVPPLPEHDVPGLRIVGEGRTSAVPAPADKYAVLAQWVTGLAAMDEQLHHGLESLTHRGLLPLQEAEHRNAYVRELNGRIDRLARQAGDSPAALRAALAVDEAVCSVVHLPPAAPGSWWAELAQASQRIVLDLRRRARERGADVAVEVLAPSYKEARQRTGGNDIPLDAGGRTGQVLAVLRLWASVEGRELRGRVVYRG
ncbi:hypothetical protein [Streptomyces sp. NPDC053542]|uniref:hypothetical protein n=1 Tax=Streptomyces sp. NPDC053542 TaxID=3365710 RepID=UPI0037CE8F59